MSVGRHTHVRRDPNTAAMKEGHDWPRDIDLLRLAMHVDQVGPCPRWLSIQGTKT